MVWLTNDANYGNATNACLLLACIQNPMAAWLHPAVGQSISSAFVSLAGSSSSRPLERDDPATTITRQLLRVLQLRYRKCSSMPMGTGGCYSCTATQAFVLLTYRHSGKSYL